MAVREDNHVKKTYYSIWGGKVVRQWFQEEAPEGFANLQKRVTQDSKKTVWYKPYIFEGKITNVEEKRNKHLEGQPFEVHLELDGESILVFKSESGYHRSFLMAMKNLPKGEEIEIRPYNFVSKDDNKRKIGLVFEGPEGKIAPYYTKDSDDGPPQPTKNRKGEWNFDAFYEFLDDRFKEWKEEYFSGAPEESKGVREIEVNDAEEVKAPQKDEDPPLDDDDVPF